MRVRACSRDADCFIRAAWGPENTACETFVCNENVMFPKLLRVVRNKKGRAFRHDLINHLFLLLPRMVASGLAACFMKAEGLMPTMFLNCLEKW